MKIYTRVIFILLCLFSSQVYAKGLQGVWKSNFGEMRLTESKPRPDGTVYFWGEYAKVGYVAGLRKGGIARGIFVHADLETARPKEKANNLGLFEWRLDDRHPGKWQGIWSWGKNQPKTNAGTWNASRISSVSNVNHKMRSKVAGYLLILFGSEGGKWANDVANLPDAEPLGLQNALHFNRKFSTRGAATTILSPNSDGESCKTQNCNITLQQGLNAARETLWKDMPIPVCWENPLVDNVVGRRQTQAAVEVTWARVSKVAFTDWSGCPSDGKYDGIRIRVEDTERAPHAKGLGSQIAGVENGISLNFTFRNWGRNCIGTEAFCIQVIAVHEFGHALGFAHEHDDLDSRFVGCDDEPNGTEGDWQVTPRDLQSVMNYCNPNWAGAGALSKFDIEGVRKLYGHAANAFYAVGGVSHEGNGAGLASWDLDGNGQPELIMLAYNDAPDSNDFRYRVARDLDANGQVTSLGRYFRISGMGHHGDGAGLALADINGNGRPEMFILADNAKSGKNTFRYKIGWDLNVDGEAWRWTQIPEIDGVADDGMGAGIDVVDVDGNGILDLVLMSYFEKDGRTYFRYRVGFDLDMDGIPSAAISQGSATMSSTTSAWRTDDSADGFDGVADGAGMVLLDLDKDGKLDMVLMAYIDQDGPNRFAYKIIWGLDQDGNSHRSGVWSNIPNTSRGHKAAGAGLDAIDVDGDGNLELLMMAYDDPNGQNSFRISVHFDAF
jgi:hypothetical protein